MSPRYRALAIAFGVAAAIAAAIGTYFSSSHTRLIGDRVRAANVPLLVRLPRIAHVVIVIEENKAYGDIIGRPNRAPYLNELAARGAIFTHAYGITHPSQPNYFAMFAGLITRYGDSCGVTDVADSAPNLASQLLGAHRTFAAYAEGLPSTGFRGCAAGNYARKQAPWTHFRNVPDASIQPFTEFPKDYARLPDVAFVVPDLEDDMHSGTVAHADAWLRRTLEPLLAWGETHDLLVIVTWDESSAALTNHIPLLMIGPMVRAAHVAEPVDHYSVLHTVEALYGLSPLGEAARRSPVNGMWRLDAFPQPTAALP